MTEANVTTRYNRIKCYKARDAYFACLDDLDNEVQEKSKCKDLMLQYHSSCMPSWIKYFDERRHIKNIPFEVQIDAEGMVEEYIKNNEKTKK